MSAGAVRPTPIVQSRLLLVWCFLRYAFAFRRRFTNNKNDWVTARMVKKPARLTGKEQSTRGRGPMGHGNGNSGLIAGECHESRLTHESRAVLLPSPVEACKLQCLHLDPRRRAVGLLNVTVQRLCSVQRLYKTQVLSSSNFAFAHLRYYFLADHQVPPLLLL